MYKVFINEKVIFLTASSNFSKLKKEIKILKFENDHTIAKALQLIQDENIDQILINSNDIDKLYTSFKSYFKYIEAAGGAVLNNKQELLLIFRLGKWDLPKGKIETGENPHQAAIREVEEECGIQNLVITAALSPTFHIYEHKGKMVLKKTFWFEMITKTENQILIPQTEEGITQVAWLDGNKIIEAMENTYENIKIIVKELLDKKQKSL
jgi:hypothetical protein